MSASQIPSTLFERMTQLLPLLEQFLHLLKEESDLLSTHPLKTQALVELTQRKQQLLDQLMPLSEALQASLPDETASLTALLKQLKDSPETDVLRRFIALSEEAEKLHLENGTKLMRLAQLNEGILRLLFGQEEAPTYQPAGATPKKRPGNKLGEA